MTAVSDVLRDRSHQPGGLQQMTIVSLLGHGVLLALVLLAPGKLLPHSSDEPKTIMTISLGGGAPGPRNGGMSTIGGRAIQQATPPEQPPKREPIRPPAAATPAMTMPTGKPLKNAPSSKVTQAPDEARGRTPTRGAETQAGSALADTGARGQGFGLSTGGGAGSGSTLDVANFCCPDYLVLMTDRVRTNWNQQAEVPGSTVIKFTIQRDGRLTDVAL